MTTWSVVLVAQDDPEAPNGSAALRLLRGAPVLRWAVAALAGAEVDRLLLVAPPALAAAAGRAVRGLTLGSLAAGGLAVELVPVPGASPGDRLRAVLRVAGPARPQDLLVLHDPLYPLATAALVEALLAALRAAGPGTAAAVPVHPLTETVMRLGPDGLVHETVDRSGLVVTATPQVYRRPALLAALESAEPGDCGLVGLVDPAALPERLLGRGEQVLPVSADDPGPRAGSAEALDRVAAALA